MVKIYIDMGCVTDIKWLILYIDMGLQHRERWNSAQFIIQFPRYSTINCMKSLASGAGNISEPWIMSQIRSVCEIMCV